MVNKAYQSVSRDNNSMHCVVQFSISLRHKAVQPWIGMRWVKITLTHNGLGWDGSSIWIWWVELGWGL